MIETYIVLSNRIKKELGELNRLISRAEKAMDAARKSPEDQGLFIDSAALNLHDVYAGFERLFRQIAATVDGTVPSGQDWHRELLQQMGLDLPEMRPPVLSDGVIEELDEYLRFRHVVRNVYTFSLDPERIERLVQQAGPTYQKAKNELLKFADFLERVSRS